MAGIDDILTQTEEKSVFGKEYQLPNGMSIQYLNIYETDFIYNEIFEKQIYFKHGISLHEGDCVFDIGANIGLFSLFILNAYKNVAVYAVEPSPDLCGLIRSNTAAYHDHIKIIQCGIAAENKEAIFSFFPKYSILSGFNTDPEADFHSLRDGLDNGQPEQSDLEKKCLDKLAMEKLEERKDYACQLKTLSALIEEYHIQTINLLKIDAEKSEKEALQGIAEQDWDKIKQIVMEVHDSGGTVLNEILGLLREKGYAVETETEACLNGTGIVNLYAIHQSLSSNTEIEIEGKTEPDRANPSFETGMVAIAATFTADPLLPGLEFWGHELGWPFDVKFAPYNQIFQELLNPESILSANTTGMNVILIKWDDWLRYLDKEKVIKNGGKKSGTLTAKKKSHFKKAFAELMAALRSYSEHLPCFTMLLLCPSSPGYENNRTFYAFFRELESQLETTLKELNGMELLKAESFHMQYRVETVFDSIGDEVGHVPYTQGYYHFLATLIARRYYSFTNNPYKAIVVDCDHTLWGGVCGEGGPEGVKVEGVYAAFQQYLAAKADAGYLLCLCSKNNEEDVWRVFQEQQGMILKKEHLVDSRLNWSSKSENIHSLANGLNLGSDSFIFFDDNPVECAEVRAHCPEVFTVEWPWCADDDSFLNHLWMLDHFQVTDEDRLRKDSYRANADRRKLRESSHDFEDFLQNLKLSIMIEPVNDASIQRVAQLTARTNQFNFTGVRRTVAELRELLTEKHFQCWTVKVSDRFGDYGVVGAFIAKITDEMLAVDTFLLSCRVLGRGVEHKIMAQLGEIARMHGLSAVKIGYRKTPKNEPARLFLEQIAPESSGLNQQQQETEIIIPVPGLIACTFQPSKYKTLSANPVDATGPMPSGSVSYENIRKKERLLCRIATELNNVKQLTAAIDNFYSKNNIATIPTVLETKSAKISKDETWRDELYPKVLACVKEIFARGLRLTMDELDEQREFKEYFQHDSLKIVAITSELSKEFPDIPSTILFEQRNLGDVTRSIIAENRDILQPKYIKEKMSASIVDGQKAVAATGYGSVKDSAVLHDDIAVIGINGRFPKASTIGEFWRNLRDGISGIEIIPNDRWEETAFFDAKGKPGKTYCKWGGFLSGIDRFEASFFHISPREAETMDPQQRLFLEIVWGLLEDAGYTPRTISRETGVYVGVIAGDYGIYTNEAAVTGECGYRNADYYQIPNRISYFFDFHGPSMAVDTACSGAGTALHLACQSLKRRECRTAIVGGVNLLIHPGRFIQYAQMQVLSKDGQCRPFGADATGTIYGEGIGAVLLKPLADAEKDGDIIYGVIKASAINSGGKTNGFTVPNPKAQAELISKALQEAKIDSGTISYVEAHGSGTPLGDPIEIRGLTQAFQENSSTESGLKSQYCALGSVKSNIGHLESGAAIAGLIKILLQMKHQCLVPSLNSEQPNPMIRFEETPFYLQHRLEPWKQPEVIIDGKRIVYPRRAGLSSFGAGGVNTHLIVEEYPAKAENDSGDQGLQLVVLSAQTKDKLMIYAAKMAAFLRETLTDDEVGLSLADMAYTLQTGREAMAERLAVIVSDVRDLISKLEDFYHDQTAGEFIFNGHCSLATVQQDLSQKTWRMDGANYSQLKCLAEYWVSGEEVDWKTFYDNACRRKIPLPTYPFSGQRYLLGEPRKYLEQLLKRDMSPLAEIDERPTVTRIFEQATDNKDQLIPDDGRIEQTNINITGLKRKLIHDLRSFIYEILKIPPEEVELNKNFNEFGFDSVSFTQFSDKINETFDLNISPAIFYEYLTMETFGEFLLQENPERFKVYYLEKGNSLNVSAKAADEKSGPDEVSGLSNLPYRYLPNNKGFEDTKLLNTRSLLEEPVAIVGMGGLFPQCEDLESFWEHLVQGDCLITEVPKGRWNWEEFYGDPQAPDKTDVKWGGFIRDVDKFDPLFFGISPREASLMDPQQRLFLETVYQAIEDAGYAPSSLSGTETGLFVGASINDYNELMKDYAIDIDPLISSGVFNCMIANRVSYLLNIHGPSEVIETACSGSLVAIGHAVDCIRKGRCDLAIAGGVNVILRPKFHIAFRKAGMISPDGRCKSFDQTADGYVRAEGAGAIVLKPLSKAIADRDHIYAVIKSFAENHGGHAQSLTAPNPKAQAELLVNAYQEAQIPIETVSYIEAHGTGTSLGDPIEINGLKQAFEKLTPIGEKLRKASCGIGSVKTNIGHLECAAGIAGVIKVLLALKYKQLPASINFNKLNSYIDLTETPFYIVTQTQPWVAISDDSQHEIPRRAGINSFGFGGSNAHIVLEEYSSLNFAEPENDRLESFLIVLSARNEERLRVYAQKLGIYLDRCLNNSIQESKLSMINLAYTLQLGRDALDERLAVVASDIEELRSKLMKFSRGEENLTDVYRGNAKNNRIKSELLFAGQEGQEFIRSLTVTGQLDKLAQLWVSGFMVDWSLLYDHRDYQRISLPTYPFARERHWIIPKKQNLSGSITQPALFQESSEIMYFHSIWEKEDCGLAFPNSDVRWILLFGYSGETKETIIEKLQKETSRSIKFILVEPDECFQQTGELKFTINPLCFEDYLELLTKFKNQQINIEKIINLWPVSFTIDPESTENKNFQAALIKHLMNFGIYVVFHLIRAIQEILPESKLMINTVYSSNGENANPFFNAIAGCAHSLKMISPDIALSVLEIAEKNLDEGLVAKIIIKELSISDWVPEVRYCDDIRYVKKIQPLIVGTLAKPTLLRKRGVYLITGGMGGLGFLFARFLAEKFQARLILVGRSSLDSQRQKLLDTIKSYGADCLYLRADIGDPPEMKRVMDKVGDCFGSLNGVIHAAGIIDQCTLFQKSLADLEKTLHPKLKGTEVLDELTKDEPLDFFVAFSSIASILGDFGQCDYAVANRFLDSFVSFRENLRAQKLRQGRTISINWPLWQDGGMHFNEDGEALYLQSSGMSYLKAEEGWESFIKTLESGETHVMIVSGISARVERFLGNINKPEKAIVPIQPSLPEKSGVLELPLQPVSASVQENLTIEICRIVSSITNIDQEKLDIEENLGAFGLDSITLKEFSVKLKTIFGVTVLPSVFFAYSSIERVCQYLLETHGDTIRNYFSKKRESVEGEKVTFNIRQDLAEKIAASSSISSVKIHQNAISDRREAIAVIGAAGIFPGSKDLEEFWNHLELQDNLITEIPLSRWDWRRYFSKDKSDKNKSISKWGAFIEDVDKFDAEFFNISRLEAESMDPQQRLYIQTVWKAIEDSGYKVSQLSGKIISVFTGGQFNDYQRILESNGIIDSHSGTGSVHAMLSNRVSYLFNFKGPSEVIDTACSGSLVAIHQAVKSIQNGESEMAIAGGMNLILSPHNLIYASQLGVLSPDGSCKTFDKTANGYVKGEGIGAVLLKPLSQAIADHDHIYTIIKGTAVNHGGKAHSLTAPNSEAQAELLIAAYEEAKIDPGTVSYIEAHGTGTELGDPVEIEGLKKAFNKLANKIQNPTKSYNYCGLGSLKTNIGHLEPAAGIAGFLKVILALKHRKLPGILHFHHLNPYIQLDNTPFYIVEKTQSWGQLADAYGNKIPRRAGVSSFGFGGTNAHVVLEEYEDLSTDNDSTLERNPLIILLSAKKKQSLQTYAKEMAEYLKKQYTQHLQPAIDEKSGIQSLESELILLISEILTINNKDCCPSDDLSEYGFDRIGLSDFTAKVNEKYKLDETPESLMNCSSINFLSRYLFTRCSEKSSVDETIQNVADDAIHPCSLEDIAYTLQVGREEMEERLAFVASSVEETIEKLLKFSQGIPQNVFTGNIKETKANLSSIVTGEEEKAYLHLLVKNNKLSQLAQLWVCGMKIDWEQIYSKRLPRRISLPTYPFAGESYWIPQIPGRLKKKPEVIHPFIDRIDFDYSFIHNKIVFEKMVTGNDLIIMDHKIGGRPIFPGVGYLEMACAAVSQICGGKFLTLSNIVWLRPLEIRESKQIRLFIGKGDNTFHYEIRTIDETNESLLHGQGDISVAQISNGNIQQISLDEIKMRSSHRLNRQTIYEKFSKIGLEYGKYFQGLVEIWGNDLEALGKLYLPTGLAQDFSSFLLHPTLADGALQTAIGLTSWSDLSRTLVPFSVAKVEILRPLNQSGYAYAQFVGENKFHVALVDDIGQVCIKFHEVSVREIKNQISEFCYIPLWQEMPLVEGEFDSIHTNTSSRKVFIFFTSVYPELKDILVKHHERDQVISIDLDKEDFSNFIADLEEESLIYFLGGINLKEQYDDDLANLAISQELGVLSLFRLVKLLSDAGYDQKSLTFKVITNNVYPISNDEYVRPNAASLHGLVKAMAKEYPHWRVCSIDIDLSGSRNYLSSEDSKTTMKYIFKEPADARGNVTVIRGEKRYLRTLYPAQMSSIQKSVFRNRGVYLILGGAGGIGLELALYLAKEVQARLVLIGRSQLSSFQTEKIKQIESAGGKVMYIMADATNLEEMRETINKAKDAFGAIHGAIHSAIVLRDKTIRNMDEESFRIALAPKVEGSVVLGKVLSGENLDFMAFFSSAQSFVGNPGQGNYIAGCTFKEAFAKYLQTRLSCPVIVFNWGYWGTVGIAANQEFNKRFAMQGVKPIYPYEGMEIFKQAVANCVKQIVPVKADIQVLKAMGVDFSKRSIISNFGIQQIVSEKPIDLPTEIAFKEPKKTFSRKVNGTKNLKEQTVELIKNIFVEVLKVKPEDIEIEDMFEAYGMDSVFALEINGKLEKFFGKLSSTLLYENMTVEKLSQYFITNYLEDLQKILNWQSENEIIEDTESLFYDVSAAMREPLDKLDGEEMVDIHESLNHAAEESIYNIDNLSESEVDLLLKNFLENKEMR